MSRECTNVEPLLGRGEDVLAGDERARLANHLRECIACRADDGALRGAVALLQRPHPPLSETARERALSAAFEAAERAPVNEAPRGVRIRALLALTAVAAVAVLVATQAGPDPARAPTASVSVGEPRARPPAGEAAQAVAPPTAAPSVQPKPTWIEAQVPRTQRFAHAEVTLRAGTRVRFDDATHTLELAGGEVQVAVDPRPHAAFAVVTQHLRVEVLGTVFTVAPTRVVVQHGRVRVLDPRGAVVAAGLTAGQAYDTRARATKSATSSPKPPPDVLLREARDALERGDVAAARGWLGRLEPKRSSRDAQAEAGTLQAECALLERDLSAAIQAYLAVAARFAALPAGENAAFAAAQLAARQRDPRTRELFDRYLHRYPAGRFAPAARAALTREAQR